MLISSMLSQGRTTGSLEESLSANNADDILSSLVLYSVSLTIKQIQPCPRDQHTTLSCDFAVPLASLALRSRLEAALAP